MGIRFKNTELVDVVARYQVGKVEAKEDFSVRFKCLVEAVINAAKYAYHSLGESYADVMSLGEKGLIKQGKWYAVKTNHRTAAESSEKKCKIYFVSVSDPKSGLLRLPEAAPQTVSHGGANFAAKAVKKLDKWLN